MSRFAKHAVWFLLATALSGCVTFNKDQNTQIEGYQFEASYRNSYFTQVHSLGENVIVLAFSGGGTRAAAFSYGVMQELRATDFINLNGKRRSLLSDVDYISAVSGGSFTAAYYGAFGDKLFTDYEDEFLRESIQGALVKSILSPSHWWRSLTTGFDRTEMAVEFYENSVFKNKTFGDIDLEKMPFIVINATDLSLGKRFAFDQDTFDLLCADLSNFSLARAVTASSAVPLVFPSVVLKNRAGECDMSSSRELEALTSIESDSVLRSEYIDSVKRYENSEDRRYIHLVDGGISDNLGLRSLSDQMELFGFAPSDQDSSEVKRLIVILVNSSVKPTRGMDQSPTSPSFSETAGAVTSALIERYAAETRDYFIGERNRFRAKLNEVNENIENYFIEVSFDSIEENEYKNFFNRLPTSLELSDKQIDALIESGKLLLRNEPEFQKLKASLQRGLR